MQRSPRQSFFLSPLLACLLQTCLARVMLLLRSRKQSSTSGLFSTQQGGKSDVGPPLDIFRGCSPLIVTELQLGCAIPDFFSSVSWKQYPAQMHSPCLPHIIIDMITFSIPITNLLVAPQTQQVFPTSGPLHMLLPGTSVPLISYV